ncbi:hypothetical protein BG004_004361, partial [Podila humilis]
MSLYAECAMPWIDTVVNNFLAKPLYASQVDFTTCCTAPGECPETTDMDNMDCPYGYLQCHA